MLDRRVQNLRAIFGIGRQLGLDHAAIADVAGINGIGQRCECSLKEMNLDELVALRAVLEERQCNSRPAATPAPAAHGEFLAWRGAKPSQEKFEVMAKISRQLAAKGAGWEYADAMAWRMFKVSRVDWCTPAALQKITAALRYDAARR